MQDDIDWMNASVDSGLIALCREMSALAAPFEAAAALGRRRAPRVRVRKRAIISPPLAAAARLNA